MKNRINVILLASVSALAVGLTGCVVTETTYVREDRPHYYAPPPEEVVVVHQAPPAAIVEVRPMAPGPDYVWIKGYYAASNGRWAWVQGHYERPRAGMVWVEPRYETVGADVRFSGGRWQASAAVVQPQPVIQPRPVVVQPQPAVVVQQPGVVIVHRPVPQVIVERMPASPGAGYVWVKGYYRAEGESWVWVGGHYERPPRAGAVWVEPRYEPHGAEVHFSVGFWR